jgi:hypothetical protein
VSPDELVVSESALLLTLATKTQEAEVFEKAWRETCVTLAAPRHCIALASDDTAQRSGRTSSDTTAPSVRNSAGKWAMSACRASTCSCSCTLLMSPDPLPSPPPLLAVKVTVDRVYAKRSTAEAPTGSKGTWKLTFKTASFAKFDPE